MRVLLILPRYRQTLKVGPCLILLTVTLLAIFLPMGDGHRHDYHLAEGLVRRDETTETFLLWYPNQAIDLNFGHFPAASIYHFGAWAFRVSFLYFAAKNHCSGFSYGRSSSPGSMSCRHFCRSCWSLESFPSRFPCSCDLRHLSFRSLRKSGAGREGCIIFSIHYLQVHPLTMLELYTREKSSKKWSIGTKISHFLIKKKKNTGEYSLAWKANELPNTEPQNYTGLTSQAQQPQVYLG